MEYRKPGEEGTGPGRGNGVRKPRVGALAALLLIVVGAPARAGDIGAHPECVRCGMDRDGFGYSRMLVVFEDGAEVGTCSLNCAVGAVRDEPGRRVRSLQVADHDTRELLEAKEATWVIGGTKPGVMTNVPKWAFGKRADAEAFVARFGGRLAAWEEARAAAEGEIAAREGTAGREGGAGAKEEAGCCCCPK